MFIPAQSFVCSLSCLSYALSCSVLCEGHRYTNNLLCMSREHPVTPVSNHSSYFNVSTPIILPEWRESLVKFPNLRLVDYLQYK